MKIIGNLAGLVLVSAGAWAVGVGMVLITDKDIQRQLLDMVFERVPASTVQKTGTCRIDEDNMADGGHRLICFTHKVVCIDPSPAEEEAWRNQHKTQ